MTDNIIRSVPTIKFGDLRVNFDYGWAYQEKFERYDYGDSYWKNYLNIEETETAQLLNGFRKDISTKYATTILDVGIGSGAYLKTLTGKKYGFDVNPFAIEWLKENNIFHDPYNDDNSSIDGFCSWDVIEHIPNPNEFLAVLPTKAFIFISLPVFANLERIQFSKHYKPNEHLQYFTTPGLIKFMEMSGFTVLELSNEESKIGRENVITIVAQKNDRA
jgi:hypothetical protein